MFVIEGGFAAEVMVQREVEEGLEAGIGTYTKQVCIHANLGDHHPPTSL